MKIKKAIIPIAGNGTRMYPETHFIKKVMLPVIDSSCTVKPALMFMLEELVECGIEEIYLIVGSGEEEYYERNFRFDYDQEKAESLPKNVQPFYNELFQLSDKIHIVVQKEKKGFGHAVFQARKYLESEPTVLLLGDFLYRSNNDVLCTQQAIDAFYDSGCKSVIGIKKIDVKDSKNYGIIHGDFQEKNPRIMDVDMMIEKPSEEYARENLLVDGNCYSTFGSYILTDEIFEYLDSQIYDKEKNNIKGETDLTSSLMNAALNHRLVAVDVDGESFDIGLPKMYYKTFVEFGKNCTI